MKSLITLSTSQIAGAIVCTEAIDADTLWAAYCAANLEKRLAANFVLLDEKAEPPEWATLDCRAWRDAMSYAAVRWLRNPPKPKLRLVK